jgi:hypothetical protein
LAAISATLSKPPTKADQKEFQQDAGKKVSRKNFELIPRPPKETADKQFLFHVFVGNQGQKFRLQLD